MSRLFPTSCLLLALAPGLLSARLAAAAPIDAASLSTTRPPSAQRSLKQRLGNVSGRRFVTAGRLELSPLLGLSLTDPFYFSVLPAAGLRYHFTEAWAAGLAGEYALARQRQLELQGAPAGLQRPLRRLGAALRAELSWLPIYGKLNLWGAAIAHFATGFSLSAGVGLVHGGGQAVDVALAVGQQYFLTPNLALRLEAREEVFWLARAAGTAVRPQHRFGVGLGLSFFLPSAAAHAPADRGSP
jgi:outer membrane beta-barrel protein